MYKLRVTKLIKNGEITIAPKSYPLSANHVVYLTEEEYKDVSVQIAIKKKFMVVESTPQLEEDNLPETEEVPLVVDSNLPEVEEELPNVGLWDAESKKLLDIKEGKNKTFNNLNVKNLRAINSQEVNKEDSNVKEDKKLNKKTKEDKGPKKRGRPALKAVGEKKEVDKDIVPENLLPNNIEILDLEEGNRSHSVVVVSQNGEVS